ncbi:MAG: septum formation initiator family protein [Treponema sp.]|nr:septum formation initiator family protein [Treponema sp.]
MRYFLVIWTFFFVYTFFSFFLGQNGLYARRHLEAERVRLYENLKKLENINTDYQNVRNNLMGDRDSLSVYARQLGYGREGEEYIRIMGLGIAINTDMPAGQVNYTVSPAYISDTTIKIISLLFAFAVLSFLLIRDFCINAVLSRAFAEDREK